MKFGLILLLRLEQIPFQPGNQVGKRSAGLTDIDDAFGIALELHLHAGLSQILGRPLHVPFRGEDRIVAHALVEIVDEIFRLLHDSVGNAFGVVRAKGAHRQCYDA